MYLSVRSIGHSPAAVIGQPQIPESFLIRPRLHTSWGSGAVRQVAVLLSANKKGDKDGNWPMWKRVTSQPMTYD